MAARFRAPESNPGSGHFKIREEDYHDAIPKHFPLRPLLLYLPPPCLRRARVRPRN